MIPALHTSCLEALIASTREVSTAVLAGAPCEPVDAPLEHGRGHGAYLSLSTPEEPIQVGLIASPEGCQTLAKGLLGMDAADEDLPEGDVSDAMCEIINMVAGGLKRRLDGQLTFTLGLPLFVAGHPLPNQQQDVCARSLRIGDVPVSLILLTQNKASAPLSRRSGNLRVVGREPAKEHSV